MKSYQKNPKNLFMASSCMFEQITATVYENLNKWHLKCLIWSLNLNLCSNQLHLIWLLVALAQSTAYCHDIIMHHNCCIALIVFLLVCRWLFPSVDVCSDDEIDDNDEELYNLQKCQASKTPLFIPI